jgi:hypothetical protein
LLLSEATLRTVQVWLAIWSDERDEREDLVLKVDGDTDGDKGARRLKECGRATSQSIGGGQMSVCSDYVAYLFDSYRTKTSHVCRQFPCHWMMSRRGFNKEVSPLQLSMETGNTTLLDSNEEDAFINGLSSPLPYGVAVVPSASESVTSSGFLQGEFWNANWDRWIWYPEPEDTTAALRPAPVTMT